MKTIILDVDDVVLNLVPNWLKLYNRDFNDNLTKEQITEWNITKFIKPEAKYSIYQYEGILIELNYGHSCHF